MAQGDGIKTSSGVRMAPWIWHKVEAIARDHRELTGKRVTNSRVIELACIQLINDLEEKRGKPYPTDKPKKKTGTSPLVDHFGPAVLGLSEDDDDEGSDK